MKGVIPRLILREVGPGQRVRDWVPRLDGMGSGQGPRLCTKARIGRNVTRTGSGTGFQAWYGTKWGQGRVRDWGPRAVLDEIGRGQGQGLYQIVPGQSQGLSTKAGI